MKLSELGEAYDTECEFVDYKGFTYSFRVKRLTYSQIQWLLTEEFEKQTKKRNEDEKEYKDMEEFCEYVDGANIQDMSRIVKYIEAWCFEDTTPNEQSFAALYAQRADVAIGMYMKIAALFRGVHYSTSAMISEVKKK